VPLSKAQQMKNYQLQLSAHKKLGFPTLLVTLLSFTFLEEYPQTLLRSSEFP
jgi:hypothetical protein